MARKKELNETGGHLGPLCLGLLTCTYPKRKHHLCTEKIQCLILTSEAGPLSAPGQEKVTNSWHRLCTTKQQTTKEKTQERGERKEDINKPGPQDKAFIKMNKTTSNPICGQSLSCPHWTVPCRSDMLLNSGSSWSEGGQPPLCTSGSLCSHRHVPPQPPYQFISQLQAHLILKRDVKSSYENSWAHHSHSWKPWGALAGTAKNLGHQVPTLPKPLQLHPQPTIITHAITSPLFH